MIGDSQAANNVHGLFGLQGKVALITGGSRGLGLTLAEALGAAGASVVIAARSETQLAEARQRLKLLGINVECVVADLSSAETIDATLDALLSKRGRLDILINNAGTTWGAPAEDYPREAWHKVLNLNVTSLFEVTRAVAKACFIPQRAGKILNVASIEGLLGHDPGRLGTIAYNTSKGAVVNMTRALAAEWGPYNINVNALAPGFFYSKMTRATLDKYEKDIVGGTPLGRLGTADDLAGPALLLTSEAGRHITGQTIVVDGGASII